jgi:hypothetical protein
MGLLRALDPKMGKTYAGMVVHNQGYWMGIFLSLLSIFYFLIFFLFIFLKCNINVNSMKKNNKDFEMNRLLNERIKNNFFLILDSFKKTLKMMQMCKKYIFRLFVVLFCYFWIF